LRIRRGGRFSSACVRGRAVNVIAAGLPVSRPALSQHLKALKPAGLVEERSEGV
jgi:DNA-binding transcriptional ArsR family regulator